MPILGSSASQSGRIPGTATITGVTAGNGQVSVAFNEPAFKGKGNVTYTVTSSPSSITATGSSSPIIVTGLSNGTSYTFTVATVSVNGVSTLSSASSSVTPETPRAGFTAGGLASGNARLNFIQKVTFSNDSISILAAGLSNTPYAHATHSNSGTAGYVCGGYVSSMSSRIDKLAYVSDSVSTLANGLTATTYESAGFSNPNTYGYVVGGQNASFNKYGNRIERTTYSTDTTEAITMSVGSLNQEISATANGATAGYIFGGFENPSGSNSIFKFNMSNNTAAHAGVNMTHSVGSSAAFANVGTAAYVSGGKDWGNQYSTIDKLTFSNDTKSTITAKLSGNRARHSGFANSGTAGYFAGDQYGGGSVSTSVNKLVFSNETISTLATAWTWQGHAQGFANSVNV